MSSFSPSSELNHYIRIKIGESKSKEEEDKWIIEDIESLKEEISKPSLQDKKQWEIILRIIYAEMLGHDTHFTHSFIVNCVQNPNYRVKRIAYIACILLIDENSPFRIMMVASIQKDLQNTCLYNKIISLNALPKMICSLNATAFIDLLNKSILNPQPIVHKKALLSLIQLEKVLPNSVERFNETIEKGLRDPDPSVMMGVIPFYLEEIQKGSTKYKHLFDVFLKILLQIFDKKLSKDYEYENQGAPWAVVMLFQILSILAKNDKINSEKLYSFLENVIRSFFVVLTDVDLLMLYELILLTLRIYPHDGLIQLCVEKVDLIERSLVMKKQDRRYLILKIISVLIELNPKLSTNYQLLLLDSLSSVDETIRQITIEILFKTVNSQNIEMICQHVESYISLTSEVTQKGKSIEKYFDLLQNKSPDGKWFLKKSLVLLSIGGSHISMNLTNRIIGSLQEIIIYAENQIFVDDLLLVFEEHFSINPINDALIQTFSWFMGAYIYQVTTIQDIDSFVISTYEHLLSQNFEQESTYSIIFSSLSKLKIKRSNADFNAKINAILSKYKSEECKESNFRIREYLKLNHSDLWKINDKIDCSLTFLEGFVRKQVFKGAKVYNPNALSNLSKPQKTVESLVTKYTKDQLEKNMKKIIQNNESEFKYSGNARWKDQGYKKELETKSKDSQMHSEVNNAYMGFGSEEIKEPEKTFTEKTSGSDLKQSLNANDPILKQKKMTSALVKEPKKTSKNDKKKNQIAVALFGGSDDLFSGSFQSKNNYFSSSSKNQTNLNSTNAQKLKVDDLSSKTTIQNESAKKQEQKVDLMDFDLLSSASMKKPQEKESVFDMNLNAPKMNVFQPYKITLEKYEQLWEETENKEHSFDRHTRKSFEEVQKFISSMNFAIIDVVNSEIVSAVSLINSNDFGLLYANYVGKGTVEFIFRGSNAIKAELLTKINEM